MKEFAFVSDFDKTMTKEDFYVIVIDKVLGSNGRTFMRQQRERGILGVEFLNSIFAKMDMTEEEVLHEISLIPFDPDAGKFINKIKDYGGDFYIVSAGTEYYITEVLKRNNISDVTLFSSPGHYENGGIKICPDPNSRYYKPDYGIDKGRVMDDILAEYRTVYFAGDSLPDVSAALKAHVAFARYHLPGYLEKEGKEYIRFDTFSDLDKYMSRNIFPFI